MDVSQLERNLGQAQIVSLPRVSGAMGLRSVNTRNRKYSLDLTKGHLTGLKRL